jgi:hypothetical protein
VGLIAGATFEWDASVLSSIHATGANVTSIDDQSGNGNNTTGVDTTPKTGIRSINGLNAIEFGHAATECLYYLGAVSSQPYTVYAVIQSDLLTSTNAEFFNGNGVEASMRVTQWAGGSGGLKAGTVDLKPHAYACVYNGAVNSKLWLDQALLTTGDGGTVAASNPCMGGDGGSAVWHGLVGFLAYSATADSDATVQANLGLLRNKWLLWDVPRIDGPHPRSFLIPRRGQRLTVPFAQRGAPATAGAVNATATASNDLLGTNTATRALAVSRTATNSLVGSNTATRALAVSRAAANSLLGADTATRQLATPRTATNSLLGTNSAARTTTRARSAANTLLGTNTAARAVTARPALQPTASSAPTP